MHDEQSFEVFSAVHCGWGPLKWITPSSLQVQFTSGDQSSEGEGLVPPCLLGKSWPKPHAVRSRRKRGTLEQSAGEGSRARNRPLPAVPLAPGSIPWHSSLLCPATLPACPVPGSSLSGTEAVFFGVETCSPFNYFSIAKIKIKYLWRNLSGLFQPWHKLAEFQLTDLYQTLLCHTHSLHLSMRMKITVSSRFKPAYTGAAGRSCVCVVPFRPKALDWIAGERVCCGQGLFPSGCLSDSACQCVTGAVSVQGSKPRWYHTHSCKSKVVPSSTVWLSTLVEVSWLADLKERTKS